MNILYRFCNFLWRQPWFKPVYGKSIYKYMSRHGQAPDHAFEGDFFGLRYRGNLRNNIEFNIFYYGAFEKPLLFFLRDCVNVMQREYCVFCDVGANIGQHSLFMSTLSSQVHAFEPWEPVRKRLQEHIALNQIENISVHPVGLGDQQQSLPFFAPTGSNQGIGSFDATSVNKGNRNIGELALFRGDDYFSRHGIEKVDLLKIDVEGFERAALLGLTETLRHSRPVMVVEISYGSNLSFRCLDELRSCFPDNYSFLVFDTRKGDGSKARRRGNRVRNSGEYKLLPFTFEFSVGQDDIVACPDELLALLPMSNLRQ